MLYDEHLALAEFFLCRDVYQNENFVETRFARFLVEPKQMHVPSAEAP